MAVWLRRCRSLYSYSYSTSSPGFFKTLLRRTFPGLAPPPPPPPPPPPYPKLIGQKGIRMARRLEVRVGEGFMKGGDPEACRDWKAFKKWMRWMNKRYMSEGEMMHRFKLFRQTKRWVDEEKRKDPNTTSGLNCFADRTHDEIPRGGYRPSLRSRIYMALPPCLRAFHPNHGEIPRGGYRPSFSRPMYRAFH